jgi:hypothetical protein
MLTDSVPHNSDLAGFRESDRVTTLDLPENDSLAAIARSIETAMKVGQTANVRGSCADFVRIASQFYEVPACTVRVLASRPLKVREQWTMELFGDYAPETMVIRVWMRTAVRKEITSFGTFLSTLCHLCCAQHNVMNSAIISISKNSTLRIPGTRAVSTREPLFFTIMREARRGRS